MREKRGKEKKFKKGGVVDMRRFMTLVLAGLMIGAFATAGMAVLNQTGTITVQCSRSLGVAVSTATTYGANDVTAAISTGSLPTGQAFYGDNMVFTIWNTSVSSAAAAQNYSLQATGGDNVYLAADWTAVSIDTYGIAGVFCDATQTTNPGASAYAAADSIHATAADWTAASVYNPSAGTAYANPTKHFNTVAGTPNPRLNLWLGLRTPTAVTATGGASRSFVITVTAK